MEKGRFHENHTEEDPNESVPIPTELPSKPDLSELPSHILRSGAVESLIHQNDDLMARLSVSLRRNSLLEEKISQVERQNETLKRHHDVMQDQLMVLQQKNDSVDERQKEADEKNKRVQRRNPFS